MEATRIVGERRRYPRRKIDRACKVYCPATRRYIAARTCDVSDGGVLLIMESSQPMAVGDRVEVVIAWDWAPVLPATAMLPARIIRSAPVDVGRTAIAVAFEEAAMMAA